MAQTGFDYESMLRWRAEWLERQMKGKLLVRATDRNFESSRQGNLKRYVTFDFTPDTAPTNWSVFVNDVKEHSGRHKHQGGLVLFVIEGNGATDIDGRMFSWKRGDLITLPVRPGGIEHQHFNEKQGEICRWVAFYYRPFEDWVCHTMTHVRDVGSEAASAPMHGEEVPFKAETSDIQPPRFHSRPEESAGRNLFAALEEWRDAQRRARQGASCIRSGDRLPWEINRHGIMRWYLHPLFLYTALRNFSAYLQYIPPASRSGVQRHPGDKVFFFVRGRGHTIVDEVSYPWSPEDLLVLPIRPNGVTYQHFNDDSDAPAFLFACEPSLASIFDLDRGSSFEELEEAPEFRQKESRTNIVSGIPSL